MTPLTAREQIGNDLGWVSLSRKNELDTLLNRIWKHYMQWREKRLEQEVAYHSHFGTEMRLWVHYTSLWCEVCLSLVVPRKEPIHWAILPFFICSSILTEVGCVRGKAQHFPVKNLKKKNLEVKLWKLLWPLRHRPLQYAVKKLGCSGLHQVYRNINCHNWAASFMFLNHIIILGDIGREGRK